MVTMTREEIIVKVEELKDSLRQAHKISQEFYEELLTEYEVNIIALKFANDSYPWEQVLEVQERREELEERLSDTSDEEFEEYVFLGDLLAVLLKPVRV